MVDTDEFMAAVPWDEHRTVLVHRRCHAGREYVRLRTWNRHRTKSVWYPQRRALRAIPLHNAEALAAAIVAAANAQPEEKPAWFREREQAEAHSHT